MDAFTMEIAGLVTQVQPMFSSTREYCRAYLVDNDPDLFVEVTPSDLVHTQYLLELEAIEDGIRVRKFPDPFLERATVQRKIAAALLDRDTILLHGSTVGLDGQAYLFTAPCGTGKSTHTRLWREAYGKRAIMINDDKPFLKITPSGVLAYGSPWSGKHGLHSNLSMPLKGICVLRRGRLNTIRQIDTGKCLGELHHQCFMPEDPSGQEKAAALVNILAHTVPLWEMECTKDAEAAIVSYEAMSAVM